MLPNFTHLKGDLFATLEESLNALEAHFCYISHMFQVLVDKDPGLTGNLLVERLVGAHIDLVSKEEYAKTGSLVNILIPLYIPVNNLFCITYYQGWNLILSTCWPLLASEN